MCEEFRPARRRMICLNRSKPSSFDTCLPSWARDSGLRPTHTRTQHVSQADLTLGCVERADAFKRQQAAAVLVLRGGGEGGRALREHRANQTGTHTHSGRATDSCHVVRARSPARPQARAAAAARSQRANVPARRGATRGRPGTATAAAMPIPEWRSPAPATAATLRAAPHAARGAMSSAEGASASLRVLWRRR